MTVQIYNNVITIPLSNLFKNITNENSYNLCNQPLQFNCLLNDTILVNNQVFYRNNYIINEIIYETEDKLSSIKMGDFELLCNTKELDKTYISNCCKRYKRTNMLVKRTKQIQDELSRVNTIETKIRTEIIHNLNFKKPRCKSHYRNCKHKMLCNKNITLFLYDLHKINDETKTKIINYIQDNINIVLDLNVELEQLFIYFSICKILKNITLYQNYLSCCITTINKNIFNLNKKYCMFNDILKGRICDKYTDEIFSEYYIFRDYDTYAIDNKNKCMCLGYVLAFSKSDNKWNVFPRNNDDVQYHILSENIDYMINCINSHESAGINLLEKQLF